MLLARYPNGRRASRVLSRQSNDGEICTFDVDIAYLGKALDRSANNAR